MLFPAFLLICVLATLEVNGDCDDVRSLETTCARYCFQVVKPMLDHTKAMASQVSSCEGRPPLSTEARLQAIERLQSEQQEMLKLLVKSRIMKFDKIGTKTYYISKDQRLGWRAAERKCRELGGRLISVQNEEEARAIGEHLTPYSFWVDIWDPKNTGDYISVNTGSKPEFVNWIPGEPNRWNNVESCVQLKSHAYKYFMNDFNCDSKESFACEFADV